MTMLFNISSSMSIIYAYNFFFVTLGNHLTNKNLLL